MFQTVDGSSQVSTFLQAYKPYPEGRGFKDWCTLLKMRKVLNGFWYALYNQHVAVLLHGKYTVYTTQHNWQIWLCTITSTAFSFSANTHRSCALPAPAQVLTTVEVLATRALELADVQRLVFWHQQFKKISLWILQAPAWHCVYSNYVFKHMHEVTCENVEHCEPLSFFMEINNLLQAAWEKQKKWSDPQLKKIK